MNNSEGITDPYTLEERMLLEAISYEEGDRENPHHESGESRNWGWKDPYMQFDDEYTITRENISQEAFLLLKLPIEDMPLYINSTINFVRIVAIWRLRIAR